MTENVIKAGTIVEVKNALNDPWVLALYVRQTGEKECSAKTTLESGEFVTFLFNYVKVHNHGNMDWKSLYAGKIIRAEVMKHVSDEHWQAVRKNMKGLSLNGKYVVLQNYLRRAPKYRPVQVRVTNYVTALSRGGLIKPEDYREV